MKLTRCSGWAFVLLGLGLLVCGLPAPVALADDAEDPGVIPVHAKPHGLTYGQWSAVWWQWAYSVPLADNPLFDTDGSDAAEGQAGPVWFLGGEFFQTAVAPGVFLGQAERTITMPAGKAVFFPLVNAEFDNLGVNPPLSNAALRAGAADFMNHTTKLFCTVDGDPLSNLAEFRVTSPTFDYFIPNGNIYDFFFPPGTFGAQIVEGAVADGVFIMLAPLSVGKHTIHFGGTVDLTDEGGAIFLQDITYHITVVPKRGSDKD